MNYKELKPNTKLYQYNKLSDIAKLKARNEVQTNTFYYYITELDKYKELIK